MKLILSKAREPYEGEHSGHGVKENMGSDLYLDLTCVLNLVS